jgi:mannosyltransferase OCH1-like enzyme
VSLKSIHAKIKPTAMFIHGYDFPSTQLFNDTIKELDITLVASRYLDRVYDRPVKSPEHKVDVVRLESLIRFGGLYFDLDVFALQKVDDLLNNEFVTSPVIYKQG